MTKKQFEALAIRDSQRRLAVPEGWWGTWRDVTNGDFRVKFGGRGDTWTVRSGSKIVSKHYSRASAIAKARKLSKGNGGK